ncbi:hypothetical protein [Glaciecola petra]|uniref:Uncharacterized protein n=1 Tax=Glaciecola petra TaxID=3075602 RepID=A0ABU2ZV50_9ALTE|nr:hypothetical protein [Aestuariibacter sp. P117]MDT0596517.1 hypothetical protein [Aestuariibacter sp. P117]
MKLSRKLLATLLITACAFSTMANASSVKVDENSVVYQITANFINNSIREVKNEINISIKNTLLTVSHQVDIDPNLPQGKIQIVDLAKINQVEPKKSKAD